MLKMNRVCSVPCDVIEMMKQAIRNALKVVRRRSCDSCDLEQEAWCSLLSVWKKGLIDTSKKSEALGYMFRVARNAMVKYLQRKEYKHNIIHYDVCFDNDEDWFSFIGVSDDRPNACVTSDAKIDIEHMLRALPENYRDVVQSWMSGASLCDYAKEHKMTYENARVRFTKALEKLQRMFLDND